MEMINKSMQRCHRNAGRNTRRGIAQRPDNSFHSSSWWDGEHPGLVTIGPVPEQTTLVKNTNYGNVLKLQKYKWIWGIA